jgi:RNA polymerase sigma-70 factor (ECF subfamily)
MVSADEEAKLVEDARRGSEDAFTELLRRHQARVRTYLARFVRDRAVIDDLGQETFLAAYRRLSTYRGEVPLGPWLLGIARNAALSYLRAEERRRQREGRKVQAALAGWLAAHLESTASEDGREVSALEECVKALPLPSARLIEEFYFNGSRGAELARRTGRSESTLWVTLLRVRRALKECVQGRLAPREATS